MRPVFAIIFIAFFFIKNSIGQTCVGGNTFTVTITNCGGITPLNLPVFSISPNPANASINIVFNNEENYELVLTDISGKQLLVLTNITRNYKINTSGYANGVYFIRLQNGNKETWVQKVEIQK